MLSVVHDTHHTCTHPRVKDSPLFQHGTNGLVCTTDDVAVTDLGDVHIACASAVFAAPVKVDGPVYIECTEAHINVHSSSGGPVGPLIVSSTTGAGNGVMHTTTPTDGHRIHPPCYCEYTLVWRDTGGSGAHACGVMWHGCASVDHSGHVVGSVEVVAATGSSSAVINGGVVATAASGDSGDTYHLQLQVCGGTPEDTSTIVALKEWVEVPPT
jgi:hypothetical protein